jgi:REP element-mobilizing transposase RayT
MPRQARLDASGTLHHVMVRGIERRRIVNDIVDRKIFVERLRELSAGTKNTIYAWALMTNHAHILLRSSEFGLSRFMRRFLKGYAISYNRRHRRWGIYIRTPISRLSATKMPILLNWCAIFI